jgi:SAM-dependent methyltransferase
VSQSTYENYSETSATYDQIRVPIGVDAIIGGLRAGGLEPARVRLLDAGCGTGSYLLALSQHLGQLAGLDVSTGMLERARPKLAHTPHVVLHHGSVLAMPFADAHFDAVLFNQVLHHLDVPADASAPASPEWPNLRRALAESHRVLSPGGALVINTCSQQQLPECSWYNALIPHAAARLARRYVPIDTLVALLEQLGFDVRQPHVIREPFSADRYFDAGGPFEKSWRNGDSIWALVTQPELETALTTLRALHDAGTADNFVRDHDRSRQSVGHALIIHAWRR